MRKSVFGTSFAAALLVISITVSAAGGTQSDPLITMSSLQTSYISVMDARIAEKAKALYDASAKGFTDAVDAYADNALKRLENVELLTQAVFETVKQKFAADPTILGAASARTVTLSKGDKLVGPPGAGIMLTSGTASITGPQGSSVINITAGGSRAPGADTALRIYYMIAEDNGSGLVITSNAATAQIWDGCRVVRAYKAVYTKYAEALSALDLFRGTNAGFELERAPQRQEALIMLIRLLGEEQSALSYTGTAPFTDLPGWADGKKYIAYGAAKEYTNGVSPTLFAPTLNASLDMYLTFVLRSLGYSDGADFIWNQTSGDLAVQLGLLTQAQLDAIRAGVFMRDHVALISYNALAAQLKGGQTTLAEKLIAAGIVTRSQLDSAAALIQ